MVNVLIDLSTLSNFTLAHTWTTICVLLLKTPKSYGLETAKLEHNIGLTGTASVKVISPTGDAG